MTISRLKGSRTGFHFQKCKPLFAEREKNQIVCYGMGGGDEIKSIF